MVVSEHNALSSAVEDIKMESHLFSAVGPVDILANSLQLSAVYDSLNQQMLVIDDRDLSQATMVLESYRQMQENQLMNIIMSSDKEIERLFQRFSHKGNFLIQKQKRMADLMYSPSVQQKRREFRHFADVTPFIENAMALYFASLQKGYRRALVRERRKYKV